MECIQLEKALHMDITIMIFVEGTLLKPKSWFSLYNHKSYLPIGNCVEIIKEWKRQGANIIYCTSRKGKQAEDIASLLKKYGFDGTELYYRSKGEEYKDIIERIQPNVLIEDNCKSIGGAWQMCITKVAPQIKEKIVSIVVGEFKGIEDLPRNISAFTQR
ncbi:hypothetical protein ACFQ3W_17585 [Paenibacillus puldeungensis]|uniref:Uncharacterized protein n=1 Tax=Paenibacillus puldeungensis TaxID=696536 RepID=A0ABW3S096_9BACL